LEALADSLRKGVVTLDLEGNSVSLHPAQAVSFCVEAKRKKDRERISLELSWTPERDLETPALQIHDREVSPFPDYIAEELGSGAAEEDPSTTGPVDADDDRSA
jgi:amphi-Trp domain-containing protein